VRFECSLHVPHAQDLLVASLFRNFLLAERIMRANNCTPVSWPKLPPTHQHPMWHAWDMAAEMCLLQLPACVLYSCPSSFATKGACSLHARICIANAAATLVHSTLTQ